MSWPATNDWRSPPRVGESEMSELETKIRMALDAKAHEVDVPVDLASRTMDSARALARRSLRDRLRSRLDAWRLGAPVTGYPRWAYAASAAAAALLLFVVGDAVRPSLDGGRQIPVAEPGVVTSDPAVGVPAPQPAIGAPEVATLEEQGRSAPGVAADSAGAGTAQIAPVPPARAGELPPKIVRTATAEIRVASFERAWSRAAQIARLHRGYVTGSQAGLERGTLTIRVPAGALDEALADLGELGELVQQSTTAEDVSAAVVDIEARLRVVEAEELQLLELLRRASGVSQTLEVRDRLNAVRQEVESLEAQREYFEDAVEYSTISATLFERGADDPDDPGDDGVLVEAWRTALRVGLTIVAGAVVVLGGLIPLAALAALAWLGLRAVRRGRV